MRLYSIFLALAFFSINSLPVTAYAKAGSDSAIELWEKGRTEVRRGLESGSSSTLKKAEKILRDARSQMPDNVNLQVEYYRLLYHLVGEKDFNKQALEKEFSLLHQKAKEVVHPPVMLDILDAFQRDRPSLFTEPATSEEKLNLLRQAIRQQPKSVLAWYILSVHQQNEHREFLALDAALMALELDKDNGSALYQAGELYNIIAEKNTYVYEETEVLGKAARHLAKAVAIVPNHGSNLYALNLLGQIYVRLGLFPLAMEVSQKAKARMIFDGILLHPAALTDALIYLGKGDEAVALMKVSREVDVKFLSHPVSSAAKSPARKSRFAAANVLKGDWKRAYTEYVKVVKKTDSPKLKWIAQWVHDVYGKKSPRFVNMMKMEEAFEPISEGASTDPWIKKINDYLTDANRDEMALVRDANGTFQKVEAHFYTALALWIGGDAEGSKRHLREAVKLKAYGYQEHFWATVFLKSELFSENKG
ncbi:hypothetical protein MMIC_P0530 [Mariprofundus micogutta]|uniref:Tetratricopeptide repeat protein n=1 Tax=Mariprofundus micogutta TaxID=1921010 RepID=A0A1L8CL04_9PROT|nr:hypothetical protein [Mariprofundus micogutta]GAV19583.1 hypothetical protein MMIC_P0530 [Mariprofundus micogutta]